MSAKYRHTCREFLFYFFKFSIFYCILNHFNSFFSLSKEKKTQKANEAGVIHLVIMNRK